MGRESPAVILYDYQGRPIGTVLENGIYKLTAQVTGAFPDGYEGVSNPVLISGYDGTNIRVLKTLADGTLKVDASVIANNDSVSLTSAALPTSATLIGGSDGTLLRAFKVTTDGILRIDPIGTTTQPISAVALPLPADAATQTTLALIKAKTDNLDVALSTRAVTGLTDTELRASPFAVTANAGSGTFAISAAALPLPSDAATETTLLTRLSETTFTGRINTFGQKSMANSTPVVLASNQSAIPVTVVDAGSISQNKVAYDIGESVIYIGTAELGAATSSALWLIKRITLVDGTPTFTEWSSSTSVWNNRAIESYS